ncbi:MAG: hypothetical protein IKK82_02150, partial [Kiritimatiellae bacterium]|nr:hypothetical protein [Kiritimatiellia bacterium]
VIGTMKGLYGQMDAQGGEPAAAEPGNESYSLIGGMKKAFVSIPENLSGGFSGFIDPLGLGSAEEELSGTATA